MLGSSPITEEHNLIIAVIYAAFSVDGADQKFEVVLLSNSEELIKIPTGITKYYKNSRANLKMPSFVKISIGDLKYLNFSN